MSKQKIKELEKQINELYKEKNDLEVTGYLNQYQNAGTKYWMKDLGGGEKSFVKVLNIDNDGVSVTANLAQISTDIRTYTIGVPHNTYYIFYGREGLYYLLNTYRPSTAEEYLNAFVLASKQIEIFSKEEMAEWKQKHEEKVDSRRSKRAHIRSKGEGVRKAK